MTLPAAAFAVFFAVFAPCAGTARAAFPPPAVEISAEHPLYVFSDSRPAGTPAAVYAQSVAAHWQQLPPVIRPYAAMLLEFSPAEAAELLPPLQQADIPVIARVSGGVGGVFPAGDLRAVLEAHTIVRGVEAAGFAFDAYSADPSLDWLGQTVETAANYGRIVLLPMEGLAAPRLMTNRATAGVYAKIRACRDYVVPVCPNRGRHTIPAMTALMGMWLEGAVANWGAGPDARWYTDSAFIEPGLFGANGDPSRMPAGLYRTMILNGAMTGAAVYTFAWDRDLWFGVTPQPWTSAILPTLLQLTEGSFIARRDFVMKCAPLALQLPPAANPLEFTAATREIDAVYDTGNLMTGVYGLERPWQMSELVPNRPGVFWVPLMAAHAVPGTVGGFNTLVQPGTVPDAAKWAELAARLHPPADPAATAFTARVGRGVFVMNSRENVIETQTFSLPELPAPVRGLNARREAGGITLAWPFREGDVAYSVWRRIEPDTHFSLIAKGIDQRQFTDTTALPDQTAAYAVTALTSDKEPLSGTVGFGESFVFSAVESRIAEEAQLTPLMAYADGKALPGFGDETARIIPPAPPLEGAAGALPWWPYYGGLTEGQQQVAMEITARIEAMEQAFNGGSLDKLMDFYGDDYKDAQGWGAEYVMRAWQWFFERYRGPRMHRQIRRWDFSAFEAEGRVSVLLYCRFSGAPLSDPAGLRAGAPVALPLSDSGEVWFDWTKSGDEWRMERTQPAVPNMRELLSFSAGPYDGLGAGPDRYPAGTP